MKKSTEIAFSFFWGSNNKINIKVCPSLITWKNNCAFDMSIINLIKFAVSHCCIYPISDKQFVFPFVTLQRNKVSSEYNKRLFDIILFLNWDIKNMRAYIKEEQMQSLLSQMLVSIYIDQLDNCVRLWTNH